MVLFISIFYTYYLLLGFHDQIYFQNKNENNTEEEPFGIPGTRTEHENDLWVKLIIESYNCFLSEIDRYYCD